MPEKSYANDAPPKAAKWRQGAMLGLNLIPLMHLILPICLFFGLQVSLPWRVGIVSFAIYLLPPLIARVFINKLKASGTHFDTDSNVFLLWWFSLQLQMIFNRLPFLEELLRFLPGVYSAWLRLWGSQIGRFTYWSPGVRILDRSFLDIGDHIVFGAGVRLNPHVIDRQTDGTTQLALAPIKIGSETLVGGYSLLTAGTQIAANETVRAFRVSPPFSHWKNGKRTAQPNKPSKP